MIALSVNTKNQNVTSADPTQKYDGVLSQFIDEYATSTSQQYSVSESSTSSYSQKSDTSTYTKQLEYRIDSVFYDTLYCLLKEEEVEAGVINESEKYVNRYFEDENNDPAVGLLTLNRLFNNSFDQPHILVGMLHILSHSEYEMFAPNAQTMALSALNHKSEYVEEYAIKCFENWQNKSSLSQLRNLRYSQKWLMDYVNTVIKELEDL